MLRFLPYAALGLLITLFPSTLRGQSASSTGPPAWQDQHSIYLTQHESHTINAAAAAPTTGVEHTARQPPPTIELTQSMQATNQSVVPAAYSTEVQPAADTDQRHLAPRSGDAINAGSLLTDQNSSASAGPQHVASRGVPLDSIYTVLSALAIVIGLFLAFVWLLRRGAKATATALPAEVVSVLGRVPLAARQFAQLLRVGNKLVLVSLTSDGAKALTEVTDPVEVDRLVGLCQQVGPHSTTKAFEQVFQQLSRESAPEGFLGNEAVLPSLSSALDKFCPPRAEAARI